MAFEKAKVLKAAEKFLSQGKINAAIKEYRQIVDNDLDDLTTLNILGDLQARAGHKDEAISCFLKIADHYREQDFRLKAIAMYKKIEKLKPSDPPIAKRLADLYAAQGLIAEAGKAYCEAGGSLLENSQFEESLAAYSKARDLQPHDPEALKGLVSAHVA